MDRTVRGVLIRPERNPWQARLIVRAVVTDVVGVRVGAGIKVRTMAHLPQRAIARHAVTVARRLAKVVDVRAAVMPAKLVVAVDVMLPRQRRVPNLWL